MQGSTIEIQQIPIVIDPKKVLGMMQCREDHPMFLELSEEIVKLERDMQAAMRPTIYVKEIYKEEIGSGILALLTLGKQVSIRINQWMEKDLMQGMLANCMADEAIFELDQYLQIYLKKWGKREGFGILRRKEALVDLPMEYQQIFLELLMQDGEIPVTLTRGMMLDPEKSMMIFFEKTKDKNCFEGEHDCKKCKSKYCAHRMAREAESDV